MKNLGGRFASLLVIVLMVSPGATWAQGIPVIDAAAIVQMVQDAAQQAKDYAVQIQQLENQVKEVQSLTTTLETSLNIDPSNVVQQGKDALMQGGAAAITGVASDVAKQLDTVYGLSGSETITTPKAVTQTTEDTARSAAMLSAQQRDALQDDATRLKDLAKQSQSATSMLESQQAGNQINVEVGQQLMQMRSKQLAQDDAMNAEILERAQERKSQRAVTDMLFGKPQASQP